MRARTLLCLLMLTRPAEATERIHRIAVLDFENLTNDRSLDWVGAAFADMMKVAIGRSREFSPVERKLLDEILKELKFDKSPLVDRTAAQRMGKLVSADSILRGSFQKVENGMRVTAEVVDVESAEVRASAFVDGTFTGMFKLQGDLVAKLMAELKGTLAGDPTPIINVEALHAFSDGVYFYRNNFPNDALPLFDQALKLEPNYAEARFYEGLTLEALERWDDAIAEFKRALPSAAPERRVKWSWEAPFTADLSRRGIIVGLNAEKLALQGNIWTPDAVMPLANRVIYGERSGKNTILYFIDLEQRAVRRVEVQDDKISLNNIAISTDRLTLLMAIDGTNLRIADSIRLYAVGLNTGTIWWRDEMRNVEQLPMLGVASDSVYIYSPANRRLVVFNDRSHEERFAREGLTLDALERPKARLTKTNGEVMILKTPTTIQAIRVSDGKDAWVVTPQTSKFTHIVSEDAVVIFEPDRRVSIIDMETGKTRIEVPVPQYANNMQLTSAGSAAGSTVLVGAKVDGNTLYFESNKSELYAVALDHDVRWHTPVKGRIRSLRVADGRVYASTDDGELVILDAASGEVRAALKIAPERLTINYAGLDIVVATSDAWVYGLDPLTGKKRWEFPATKGKEVTVVQGVLVAKTSAIELSALDAGTGAVLWQYSSKQARDTFVASDSFFIAEENGIKEYDVTAPDDRSSSTNREVLTELAHALLAKGDLAEAGSVVAKAAREIDPDYPPLRALRARIENAKGNRPAAARELAAYASLVGAGSRAGQRALAELKEAHGLIWRESLDLDPIGEPALIGDKLISVGGSSGPGKAIVALNPNDGTTRWRQVTERFSDTVIDETTGRAWMVSGDERNPAVVVLYSLSLDIGERKELARWTQPSPVGVAAIAYAHDRVFVLAVSPDLRANRVSAQIDSFSAAGARLWTRTADGPLPFGVFAPQGQHLAYSVGDDLWVLNAADGSVVHQHHEDGGIAPQLLRTEPTALYFVTGKQQIVGYDAESGAVTSRATLPAVNLTFFSFFVSGGALYATDIKSVFALDLRTSRVIWRAPAPNDQRFLTVLMANDKLLAFSEDAALQLDRTTGKVLAEQPMLWPAAGFRVAGDTLYVFTTDRAAYAMQIKTGDKQ